jgi:hypothetical protein
MQAVDMNITISGPGGPGLRRQAERIIRAIETSWMITVESSGSPTPEDNDYVDLLIEMNRGKTSNSYGDVVVYVMHQPWGG